MGSEGSAKLPDGLSGNQRERSQPFAMLLDDEPDTAEMYRLGLEAGGFRVAVATEAAELFEAVEHGRLADPVFDVGQAWRAGEPDSLDELCVQVVCLLRVQIPHRVDAEPADQWDPSLHARDFEQRALMGELEKPFARDAGLFEETFAVDIERCAMQELVGVVDADSAQAADIIVGDSIQVLERPVHRHQLSVQL